MAMNKKAVDKKVAAVKANVESAVDHNVVRTVPVSMIKLGAENFGRPSAQSKEDPEQWTAFVNSVNKYGVIQPLLVAPYDEASKTYTLIAGHRRLKAVKEGAKHKTVPVYVVTGKVDPKMVARIENVARRELNPMQKAIIIKSMVDEGMNKVAIGNSLGESHGTVANYLKFLDMPEKDQQDVIKGFYTFAATLNLEKIRAAANPEVVARIQQLAEQKAAAEKARKAQSAAVKNLPASVKSGNGNGKAGGKGKGTSAVQARHVQEAASEVAASDPSVKAAFNKAGGAVAKMANRDKTIADLDVVVETYFQDSGSTALEMFATVYGQWRDDSIDGEGFATTFGEVFGLYADGGEGEGDE